MSIQIVSIACHYEDKSHQNRTYDDHRSSLASPPTSARFVLKSDFNCGGKNLRETQHERCIKQEETAILKLDFTYVQIVASSNGHMLCTSHEVGFQIEGYNTKIEALEVVYKNQEIRQAANSSGRMNMNHESGTL